MAAVVQEIALDTLGQLGQSLEQRFGPNLLAIILVKQGANGLSISASPRYELRNLPHPRREMVEPIARRLVDMLGVPSHVLGRRYLTEALVVIAEHWPTVPKITEGVYPEVARLYPQATGSRVERAIRHAVEVAEAHNPATFRAMIGHMDEDGRRPSNSQVMFRLLELLEDDLRGGRA